MTSRWFAGCLGAIATIVTGNACNVKPTAADHCDVTLTHGARCPAAALVVMSDFVSSQVALSRLDGRTLCSSLVSSARDTTSSVAFAFSGDVVLPSTPPASGRAVLIDRFGTNVVSFLDGGSGAVVAQLPVGTGFESNPQDYLELDATRALVSRWGENPVPGQEPFDSGGDLLVIDTRVPQILGSMALPHDDDLPPRPTGLTRIGDRAVVTLQRQSIDIRNMGDAELVGVDVNDESIAWKLTLRGIKNCGALALAPDGQSAALACSGFIEKSGATTDLAQSGLVLFDLTGDPPRELGRLPAAVLAGEALQSDVEFYAPNSLLIKTQTALGGAKNNRLLAVTFSSASPSDGAAGAANGDGSNSGDMNATATGVTTLLEARASAAGTGKGVVYGGLLCTPGCGDICLLADADRGVIERWQNHAETLERLDPVTVVDSAGLPPRDIGAF